MRWFETPSFDFITAHRIAYFISAALLIASIIGIVTKGLQYGIDFRGGKEYVLEFEQPVQVADVRSALTEPLGGAPEVKTFGEETDVLIRTDNEGEISVVENIITSTMSQVFPDNEVEVGKTYVISARFSDDLRTGAINAIIFALVVIFIYILIRFKNWTFSLGAVAALFHDVIIVLGVFTIFNNIAPFSMQIDQAMIAAFLTIVGYSLNDTVVVYDRIRENMLQFKTMDYYEMINKSLNDTLSRTVITSITTLFVVTVLFIFGGEVLKGFSFALMLGVIIGTYSSLFVASATVVELHRRREAS